MKVYLRPATTLFSREKRYSMVGVITRTWKSVFWTTLKTNTQFSEVSIISHGSCMQIRYWMMLSVLVVLIGCFYLILDDSDSDSDSGTGSLVETPMLSVDSLYVLLQKQQVANGSWVFESRLRKRWSDYKGFEAKGDYVLASKSKPVSAPQYVAANGVITTRSFLGGRGLKNKERMLKIFGTTNVDSARYLFKSTSKMLVEYNVYEIHSWLEKYPNTVSTFDSLTYLYGYTELDTVPSDVDASKIQYSADSLFWLVPLP